MPIRIPPQPDRSRVQRLWLTVVGVTGGALHQPAVNRSAVHDPAGQDGAVRLQELPGHEQTEPRPRRRVHPGAGGPYGWALLRWSGFVTEAFGASADAHSIMRLTCRRDLKMLEVHAREFAPQVGTAVLQLDL